MSSPPGIQLSGSNYPAGGDDRDTSRLSLRRLLSQHRAQRLSRIHWEHDQRYAWFVQDTLAACGLIKEDYSIAGGRVVHIPQVVAMLTGSSACLECLDIRILPGQLPEDFAAQARRLAYHLGVAEVRVDPLDPPLIRLKLLPKAG